MKTFLIKTILFLLLICIPTLWILGEYSKGYLDDYYSKLSSPKTNALIMGTSSGSQGLIPSLIAKNTPYENTLFNFAFTNANSPYGDIYFEAIQKKIADTTTNGLFILEMNTLSLGVDTTLTKLRETNKSLDNLFCMSNSPNYEYILKKYPKPLYKLILKNNSATKGNIIHRDGWLQNPNYISDEKRKENIKMGIEMFTEITKKYKLSTYRIQSLKKTIAFLKQKGRVYLVRLPMSKEMLDLEYQRFPEFNSLIEQMAKEASVPYLNYTAIPCKTNDIQHLSVASAIKISLLLNTQIRKDIK